MTPYEVLGLEPNVSRDEIKLRYKRLARQHHPDKGGDPEDFVRVQRAYDHLMKQVCTECQGTGWITIRRGAFVEKKECPTCWERYIT